MLLALWSWRTGEWAPPYKPTDLSATLQHKRRVKRLQPLPYTPPVLSPLPIDEEDALLVIGLI